MIMEKNNYFGIYIGQKVILTRVGNIANYLPDVFQLKKILPLTATLVAGISASDFDCKLILRTFEDMTEEEINRYRILNIIANTHDDFDEIADDFKQAEIDNQKKQIKRKADVTAYLISIGIDVFGLIERGWAVRESEVNK